MHDKSIIFCDAIWRIDNTMINAFSYCNPTKVHFGVGSIPKMFGDLPQNARVLLLYGGGSIKNNGVYEQVLAVLERAKKEKGISWGEFSGIEPNPRYETLMQAVELIEQEAYDFLLPVGGGSVVDGSKFVAAAVMYCRQHKEANSTTADPWAILDKGAAVTATLPIGCVLTLPATGTESNGNSVVTRGKSKLAFSSPLVWPRFAVLDPETTLSLSPRQVSNGVIDAYAHVLEQYLTYPSDAKIQDRFAEGILQTLVEEGPKALAQPKDLAVRSNIMWAATQALNGLIGVGVPQDWVTHAIGHELTALYGIDHGRSLSIIFPAVMKFCREHKHEKLLQYGQRIFGTKDIDSTIQATIAFFRKMNSPVCLADEGLGQSNLEEIMNNSIILRNYSDMGERGTIGIQEIRHILELAIAA